MQIGSPHADQEITGGVVPTGLRVVDPRISSKGQGERSEAHWEKGGELPCGIARRAHCARRAVLGSHDVVLRARLGGRPEVRPVRCWRQDSGSRSTEVETGRGRGGVDEVLPGRQEWRLFPLQDDIEHERGHTSRDVPWRQRQRHVVERVVVLGIGVDDVRRVANPVRTRQVLPRTVEEVDANIV